MGDTRFSSLKKLGSPVGVALLTAVLVAAATATATSLITGAQIKNGTLTLKDFKPSERAKLVGPKGPRGQQGATGPTGPLGAAGGDLTGSYPNPQIAANAVGSAEVTDHSLKSADIGSTRTDTIDFVSFAAHTCSSFAVQIPADAASTDIVFMVPDGGEIGDSSSPLTIETGVASPGGGYGTIHICNVSNSAFDPPSETFQVFTIRQ